MPQTEASGPDAVTTDLLNRLLASPPGSPLAALRAQRGDVARYTQGSYDALLRPSDPADVSPSERSLVALRVAILTESATLAKHYGAQLVDLGTPAATIAATERPTLGAPLSPRLIALLQHVDLLTNEPSAATPAHLAELQMVGLGARDIVTIAQLIAFLSFQVRTLAALQLFAEAA